MTDLRELAKAAAATYDEHRGAALAAPIGDPLRRVHTALGDLANAVLTGEPPPPPLPPPRPALLPDPVVPTNG